MTKEIFEKYQIINNKSFVYDKENSIFRFDNNNTIYYYYVQRNLKAGEKLKSLNHLLSSIKLLKYFSSYFSHKYNNVVRFQNGFHSDFALINQYRTIFPTFSLRLQNEYKGKHKTKRKFMYPILLE